jgi:hypothetical protein
MTRLFKLAAGMGLPSSRYARLEQAHTGDLQKRRYTNYLRTTTLISKIINSGRTMSKPIIQRAPARVPRLSVQPIQGIDFGTHTRVSFLLKYSPADQLLGFDHSASFRSR